MLNFITKFSTDATVSIVSSQAVLVILTVFGGGMFIAWNKCPDYWIWLQEISLFTQASRAAILNVDDSIEYRCILTSNMCFDPFGNQYNCKDGTIANGECKVAGREVLFRNQGISSDYSKWASFGYLVLIFGTFRLLSLFLMYYPVEKLTYWVQDWYGGLSAKGILDSQLGLRRLEGQLNSYIALHSKNDEESGLPSRELPKAISVRESSKSSAYDLFSKDVETESMRPLAHGSCLEWKGLSVLLKKNGKKLIDEVSGVALPGRILALMGPSGESRSRRFALKFC